MRHPLLTMWEDKLKQLFDAVDDYLEEKYGTKYSLHPRRAKRGTTANKEQNGLFNVGASFSAGYGSALGRGYVIDVNIVTLDQVPDDVEEDILIEVVDKVKQLLPEYFSDRDLDVEKDGRVFKIHGDFTLGALNH